jgi:hypothetical protein
MRYAPSFETSASAGIPDMSTIILFAEQLPRKAALKTEEVANTFVLCRLPPAALMPLWCGGCGMSCNYVDQD